MELSGGPQRQGGAAGEEQQEVAADARERPQRVSFSCRLSAEAEALWLALALALQLFWFTVSNCPPDHPRVAVRSP